MGYLLQGAPPVGSGVDSGGGKLVQVATTSTIISESVQRKVYQYRNSSTGGQNITLALFYGPAVLLAGIVLAPGQAWVDSNNGEYKVYMGTVSAIADASGAQLSVYEA